MKQALAGLMIQRPQAFRLLSRETKPRPSSVLGFDHLELSSDVDGQCSHRRLLSADGTAPITDRDVGERPLKYEEDLQIGNAHAEATVMRRASDLARL